MSFHKTKDDVIIHKKNSIKRLNALLEGYINSEQADKLKKADLISYWVEDFAKYISFESKFDPTRIISYSRGDVVRLNFGFNIGGEMGGLHFAVVLDNDSKHHADVLTVVPLSSTDGKEVHHRSVDLGSELFTKIDSKQQYLTASAIDELDHLTKIKDVFDGVQIQESPDVDFESTYQDLQCRIDSIAKRLEQLKRNEIEISRLKHGSMAVTNQITTISKQRIYTPKKSEDFLYGVSLSDVAMDKITNKIKELYLR